MMKKNFYNTPYAEWIGLEEDDIMTTSVNSNPAGEGNIDIEDPGNLW